MLEDIGSNVGDHALADPVHAIEANGRGDGEDEADAKQRCEVLVHQFRL